MKRSFITKHAKNWWFFLKNVKKSNTRWNGTQVSKNLWKRKTEQEWKYKKINISEFHPRRYLPWMKCKEEELGKIKIKIGIINKLQFGARGSGIHFLIKTSSFIKTKSKKRIFIVVQNYQRKLPHIIYRTQFQNPEVKEKIYLFYETRVEFNPLYYL